MGLSLFGAVPVICLLHRGNRIYQRTVNPHQVSQVGVLCGKQLLRQPLQDVADLKQLLNPRVLIASKKALRLTLSGGAKWVLAKSN